MKATTYLHFDGNCREAMSFYQQSFGGDLHLQPYPDQTGKPPTDPKAPLMHSQLSVSGEPLIRASDSSPEGPVKPGNNFSVSVDCESLEEIKHLFNAIGGNGKVRLPLSDMPWGSRFGMLTDKFGIQWLFSCAHKK